MLSGEELPTGEMRHRSDIRPGIISIEKLVALFEGILQMGEAQARGISSIAGAISEIRLALDGHASTIYEIKNAVERRTDEAIQSDIHGKLKALSESWGAVASSAASKEERLLELESIVDNSSKNINVMLKSLENMKKEEQARMLHLSEIVENAIKISTTEKRDISDLYEKINHYLGIGEANKRIVESLDSRTDELRMEIGEMFPKFETKLNNLSADMVAAFERLEDDIQKLLTAIKENAHKGEDMQENIHAINMVTQQAFEVVKGMKEVLEVNNQVTRDLHSIIDARLLKNGAATAEKINHIASSLNEKIGLLESSLDRKADKMKPQTGAWTNNFRRDESAGKPSEDYMQQPDAEGHAEIKAVQDNSGDLKAPDVGRNHQNTSSTRINLEDEVSTPLDRLYRIVLERKKIKISEAAKKFNISEKQVEEWAHILETRGLVEIHYPIVGKAELRKK